MMYTAKVAVFWDPYETLNAKRASCTIFECQTLWYVYKPLGFKRLKWNTFAIRDKLIATTAKNEKQFSPISCQ